MREENQPGFIQGSLFEEDYLIRTLGPLAHSPEVALTELVANAWDAGAQKVSVIIPENYGEKIIIEDDGVGLTKEQFLQRWMKLGYNRLKHQGKNVVFPPEVEGTRLAYGRNGVGRHGLLCFNSEYTVITKAEGEKSTFIITTLNDSQPFVVKEETLEPTTGHGTRLEVIALKHLPTARRILEVLSAKFLHDPKFNVLINNQSVQLEEHSGLIDSRNLEVGEIKLTAHLIDTQKSSRSTIYQGIAFWQSNRLVGEPSWILGKDQILDGRTKFAKRYTVVVKSDDLAEYIFEDWTGFKKVSQMDTVYNEVGKYVNEMLSELARENIEETKQNIREEFSEEYSKLPPLAKYEVSEAIESITLAHPTAKPETISIAVEAIINLEKTRTGQELLFKISKLNDDDVSGLNNLLDKWSIRDALSVLDEIDNRLSIIEAIRQLSDDDDVDELHVLHPLVTSARWLFGPEFESSEYSSNKQLHTSVMQVFNKKIQKNVFNNHKKRPDIVALANSTISVTGTEQFDPETELSFVNRVLIIELKKGGYKIGREERNQAQGYVEDFINCGSLLGNPYIEAFVVGQGFSEKVTPMTTVSDSNKNDRGKIRVTTFGQLVDTANRRLFRLREKLSERYDDIPAARLIMKPDVQLAADFNTNCKSTVNNNYYPSTA